VKYYLTNPDVPREEQACKSICTALAKFMQREVVTATVTQFWKDLVGFSIQNLNNSEVNETFSKRLYSILLQLRKETPALVTLDYVLQFTSDVFYESCDKALEQDSNVHLSTVFRIADVISMKQLLLSVSDQSRILEPAAFYHKYIVSLFKRYLTAETNEKNNDFIESLYGVIGEYFNIFPEQFSEFDVIIDQLVDRPHLLYVLVQGIYTAQKNVEHKLHNAKLDQILVKYINAACSAITVENQNQTLQQFNTYIDMIQYLSANQKVVSSDTLHDILQSISNTIQTFLQLTTEQQRLLEINMVRLVQYLQATLLVNTINDLNLKLTLMKQIFTLRIYDTNEVMYISELFYETCVQIGAIKPQKETDEVIEENMKYTTKPDELSSEFINSQDIQSKSATTEIQNEQHLTSPPSVSDSLSGYDSDSESEDESEEDEAASTTSQDEEQEVEQQAIAALVDSSALQNINILCESASVAWKALYPVVLSTETVSDFISQSVESIKKLLVDPKSLTISHSQLLMQADTLENIGRELINLPASDIWNSLIFDRDVWQSLRNSCEDCLRQITIGNDVFLIPFTSDENKANIATYIQLYGRFIGFALDKLFVYVRTNKIFASDAISSLNNLWLVTEILHAFQSQLVVNANTASNIKDFISEELLPSLLSTSGKISYGQELCDRFIEVCNYLMSQVEKENNPSYYKDLKSFIMSTLSYMHRHYEELEKNEQESGSVVSALRQLFSEVCSKLLFKQDLESLLNSTTASTNFTQVIESFFSAYLNEKTFEFVVGKLRAGIARQYRENQEDSLYEKTITWISQCASILMQMTQEIANKSFEKEKGERLMNLLRIQSSLAIFLNHLKDPEESIVSMHFVVSVTSEFTNTLLASDFANDFMEQVDLIVSRMLFYVYRNTLDGGLVLDEQNDEFLVSFVEQHITRCTSLLSARAFTFDELARMVETLYYMIELSVSFVHSRLSSGNQETVRRVYTMLLNTLNALAEFQLLLETERKYQPLKIFQRVNDRLINDISVSIRNISSDIFTAVDKGYEGDNKFSLSLLNILQTSTSIHALITAHDLLTKHQDTSYFVVKKESSTEDKNSNIAQVDFKYELLPTLVQLLKRPHSEVRLAPIYEHLKWVNLNVFIDRNEERNLHYRMLPYFLAWSIVAHLYEQGNDDQKAAIFSTLKDEQSYITILNSIVSYLLTGSRNQQYGLAVHELITEKDLTSTDTSVAITRDIKSLKSMADAVTHTSIARLGAQIFFRLMKVFPSLIRQWHINCTNDRTLKSLNQFLTTKLCPIVIEHEEEEILRNTKTSMPDHVKVKVMKKGGQISAIYQQDEVNLDITLSIPPNYPLKPLKIESSKRLGVSEMQWRKWTLKMTSVLFTHEGKLWDSLNLWKENLDRHFEGVEACPICYSIVHTHDHALPKIKCKTCKSKYHGACLYKWFNTSGNTTCPMCRSAFLA
jgi:hypothetical protein